MRSAGGIQVKTSAVKEPRCAEASGYEKPQPFLFMHWICSSPRPTFSSASTRCQRPKRLTHQLFEASRISVVAPQLVERSASFSRFEAHVRQRTEHFVVVPI